ncbi:glutathionylspermidine synthase family protein [Bacillus timonensis]|nr:glutathionylspermidine synthase family protein [Bacillus timonensis]
MNQTYQQQREAFYNRIDGYWHNLYGMEYSLYHVYPLSQKEVHDIQEATERIGHIFFKTASILRNLPDETLLQLGFPTETLPFLRHKVLKPESIIARCDLVKTMEGHLKLLELNSDTPTFIKECFHVNGLICHEFNVQNPNVSQEKLLASTIQKAIEENYKTLSLNRPARVVFTAHHLHEEDWNTARYLQKLSNIPSACIPLEELRINEDGLFDSTGERIDILYRQTYPIEYLITDVNSETGDLIGKELLHHVIHKKLAIINPISSFLLQSKAVQAVIWGLYEEDHSVYSNTEKDWIQTYFLPTYLDADAFVSNSHYVKKPAFGREGGSVKIFSKEMTLVTENKHDDYSEELPIYQQYVDLPTIELATEKGKETLSYMIGSFLLAGKPSAIGIRAGEKITGNESYFLPVGIKE